MSSGQKGATMDQPKDLTFNWKCSKLKEWREALWGTRGRHLWEAAKPQQQEDTPPAPLSLSALPHRPSAVELCPSTKQYQDKSESKRGDKRLQAIKQPGILLPVTTLASSPHPGFPLDRRSVASVATVGNQGMHHPLLGHLGHECC